MFYDCIKTALAYNVATGIHGCVYVPTEQKRLTVFNDAFFLGLTLFQVQKIKFIHRYFSEFLSMRTLCRLCIAESQYCRRAEESFMQIVYIIINRRCWHAGIRPRLHDSGACIETSLDKHKATDASSVTNCRSEITREERKDNTCRTWRAEHYQRLAGLDGVMTWSHSVEARAPKDTQCPAETINQASNNGQNWHGRGGSSLTRDLEDYQTCRRVDSRPTASRRRGWLASFSWRHTHLNIRTFVQTVTRSVYSSCWHSRSYFSLVRTSLLYDVRCSLKFTYVTWIWNNLQTESSQTTSRHNVHSMNRLIVDQTVYRMYIVPWFVFVLLSNQAMATM